LARPDFRAVAARRLSEERELSPSVVNFLAPESIKSLGVRHVPIDRIVPNPENPRLLFEESALEELAARRSASTASSSRSSSAQPTATTTSSSRASAAGAPRAGPASRRSPP
jgi:hypothetical protein